MSKQRLFEYEKITCPNCGTAVESLDKADEGAINCKNCEQEYYYQRLVEYTYISSQSVEILTDDDIVTTKVPVIGSLDIEHLRKYFDLVQHQNTQIEIIEGDWMRMKRHILNYFCSNLNYVDKELLRKIDFFYSSEKKLYLIYENSKIDPQEFIKQFIGNGIEIIN